MKKLCTLFTILAVFLSEIMCVVVAYSYREMFCGIAHQGFSAPATVAFLYAIPFIAAIVLCAGLAIHFRRKVK